MAGLILQTIKITHFCIDNDRFILIHIVFIHSHMLFLLFKYLNSLMYICAIFVVHSLLCTSRNAETL